MPDCIQMNRITGGSAIDFTPEGGGLCDELRLARTAWEIARRGSLAAGLSDAESDLVDALGAAGDWSTSDWRTSDASNRRTADRGTGDFDFGVHGRNGAKRRTIDAGDWGAGEGGFVGGVDGLVGLIASGSDPLGDALMRLRPPERRRRAGAIYTPAVIVSSMVNWLAGHCSPARVVDPGTGSARFLLAAGRALPNARLVGVEIDPLAALLARANLTAAGLDRRSTVIAGDYRSARLGPVEGATAFICNPPYVRHHQIEPEWKAWLADTAASLGLRASRLAGLHVHFLLATAARARPGDVGTFVTSAEWLDVNYGKLPRELLATTLGGLSVHLIAPEAAPFKDAATTAAVSCFETGTTTAAIRLKRVRHAGDLGALDGGEPFNRELLARTTRWSPLLNNPKKPPAGHVELGEICRVHRGAVTGANSTWITHPADPRLPPGVLLASITRAAELFNARDGALSSGAGLRVVIDLPADLDALDAADRHRVEQFLRSARTQGAHNTYTARHRNPWWSIGLRCPAPILATYMARRTPAFVRNPAQVRNINVAHGIYPREPMTTTQLDTLAAALRAAAPTAQGRTYAGGLLKFEPSEIARIPILNPKNLQQITS